MPPKIHDIIISLSARADMDARKDTGVTRRSFAELVEEHAMREGISATLVETSSVVDNLKSGNWYREAGVRIELHGVSKPIVRKLWDHVRLRKRVECAHVRVLDGSFAGCVLDYLSPSLCTGADAQRGRLVRSRSF